MNRVLWSVLFLTWVSVARADGPADNQPENVRRVPKPGVDVPEADAAALRAGLKDLDGKLDMLRAPLDNAAESARRQELLPDVEIFRKAVHDALEYHEFFDTKEIPVARELLEIGHERADQLLRGEAPWTTQTGLVVRGYRSRIDQSVQPYGLVIPKSYQFDAADSVRLDFWFHGRGEVLSELNFIQGRRMQVGQIAPPHTIVLHPYGRYCNANKFAGEIDSLEALDSVRRRYRIDEDRISVRGFSMGGAACWQFAVHYADRWASAAPGAGFSETPDFLKVFQKETLNPTWYERKLWRWYDCTDWAVNLAQCPTVAYSGEIDSQKQAADVMEAALAKVGIPLVHLIGPQTGHSYHPAAAAEIERRLSSILAKGRNRIPETVNFTTYSLRYNRMAWVRLHRLAEHWEPASVVAKYGTTRDSTIRATTRGVRELSFEFEPGWCPFVAARPVTVEIDGQRLKASAPLSDGSWELRLHRDGETWALGPRPATERMPPKKPGLQGPIDDAFLEAFVFVKPSGAAAHPKVDAWARAECDRAIEHWRRHFRGEPQVRLDTEITAADIASSNLVLWGDPSSNSVLKRVVNALPLGWSTSAIEAGTEKFDAGHHALIAIHPNPLNTNRYVVLNSGFTFRDYDYLNNARQTPKLPDWAIVNVDTPPDSRWPGKVVAADFFGESWELRPARPRE